MQHRDISSESLPKSESWAINLPVDWLWPACAESPAIILTKSIHNVREVAYLLTSAQ